MPFLGTDAGDRPLQYTAPTTRNDVPPPIDPLPVDLGGFTIIADILSDLQNSQATAASGSTYLQEVQAALARDQFSFQKTQWADQLKQWGQQFGFSKDQFDTSTQLQRDQMTQNATQFQAQLSFNKVGQDNAWTQYLETFHFQQEQFEFSKESFSDQLDFSKLQFEENMGFSYAQLEQQLGMQQNQLTFQREQLSQASSQFAAELGLRTQALGLQRDELSLNRELGLGQLKLGQGQLDLSRLSESNRHEIAKGSLALADRAQSFEEKTITTQMLMQAAGLASSPTGAIQLAYMARGAGAPSGAIAEIFSNLPFVQAALQGKTLPGFGVPEQLGGVGTAAQGAKDSGALVSAALGGDSGPAGSDTGTGNIFQRGLGVTLPGMNTITEEQFTGMKSSEKLFLGALYQSETGIPIDQVLSDIQSSFIPTTSGSTRLGF